MITFVIDGGDAVGLHRPLFVCDACGQQITRDGNVYWLQLLTGEMHPQVWHTHKGDCALIDSTIAAEHGGGAVYSEELRRHIIHLSYNLWREHPAEATP